MSLTYRLQCHPKAFRRLTRDIPAAFDRRLDQLTLDTSRPRPASKVAPEGSTPPPCLRGTSPTSRCRARRGGTRRVFDRNLDDLRTPLGLVLSIEATYDARSDDGRLVIRSAGASLVEVAPLSRRFQMVLALPTEEELCVTALVDA
jgi:hypothetical protein